jgi:catechol 2,3-dioxygenase-like lactoylglutathione lyase family enzyme
MREEGSMFQGLRTIVYPVPDLESAKGWYTRMLGFEPYFDQPFYVGFNVGGYELGLLPRDPGTESEGPVTYWGVRDAAEAVRVLQEAGASPKDEPSDVGDGIIVAAVRDPSGNVVGVIQNPYFKIEDSH